MWQVRFVLAVCVIRTAEPVSSTLCWGFAARLVPAAPAFLGGDDMSWNGPAHQSKFPSQLLLDELGPNHPVPMFESVQKRPTSEIAIKRVLLDAISKYIHIGSALFN